MVRHTQVDVPAGVCYGHSDVPLKTSFDEEAKLVAEALRGQVFDAVYTSPSSRCTRLAAYCGYPDAIRDARLKELNFGDWELQHYDEIKDPQLQRWFDDHIYQRPSNGESFAEQVARVGAFLDERKAEGIERLLIFGHGGTLRAAHIHAGAYAIEEAFEHGVQYGEVQVVGF